MNVDASQNPWVVVSTDRAVTLIDADWQLAAEIARLSAEAEEIERAATEARITAQRHVRFIRERYAAEMAELEAAQKAVADIIAARHEREQKMNEAFMSGFNSRPGGGWGAPPKPEPVKPARNARRTAKKLYLAIAMRCHPDKTDDPDLHEIYLQAQAALAADDVDTLKRLAAACKGGVRKGASAYDLRRARLRAKLKKLAAQKAENELALTSATNSPEFRGWLQHCEMMATMGEEGTDAAIRASFAEEIAQWQARLAQLKAPPQMQTQWVRFQTTATGGWR